MKLKGRRALVTGSGSGIGRAIAKRFAEEGARVAVNDVDAKSAHETADEIDGLVVRADVSDPDAVRAMFELIRTNLGGLDILVNNAGIAETAGQDREELNSRFEARVSEIMSGKPIQTQLEVIENMSDDDWDRMLRVHLYGTFHCTRGAVKLMGEGSTIVNMSSILGLVGSSAVPHYAAAKGGILALTKSLAQELGSRGIRVNAICPGWIDTPMTQLLSPFVQQMAIGQTPLGRIGTAEEVASVALFLASDDSSFVTGQWVSPNGGLVIV